MDKGLSYKEIMRKYSNDVLVCKFVLKIHLSVACRKGRFACVQAGDSF